MFLQLFWQIVDNIEIYQNSFTFNGELFNIAMITIEQIFNVAKIILVKVSSRSRNSFKLNFYLCKKNWVYRRTFFWG